jgi:PKD repeat protein
VTIDINVPPVASFSSSQINCSSIISFTNLSQNSLSYLWNFDDGFIDTTNSPSHTYSTPGIYNVSLITFNTCSSDTFTQVISVAAIPHPSMSMSFVQQNCSLLVDFNSTISNVVSFMWDLGDGTTDVFQNITHTYPSIGTYTVLLIAQGSCVTDTLANVINVTSSPQSVSQFNSTTENCSYNVSFSNQSLNATFYSWDFGDSTFSQVPSPQHLYSDSGTYSIKLISSNSCGTDTAVQLLSLQIPVGQAMFNYQQSICESNVHFMNQSLNGYNHYWNFGDGLLIRQKILLMDTNLPEIIL